MGRQEVVMGEGLVGFVAHALVFKVKVRRLPRCIGRRSTKNVCTTFIVPGRPSWCWWMNASTVVWIYAAQIVAGGLMGFLKARSKASLIMSVACALPLVLTALGRWPLLAAELVAGFLLVFFGIRYAKSKKIMPGGMMAGASLITLGLLLWLTR